MKLSQLIRLKNELTESVDTDEIIASIDNLVKRLDHVNRLDMSEQHRNHLRNLVTEFTDLKSELSKPRSEKTLAVSEIDREISSITKDYFARGYSIIEGQIATNSANPEHERTYRKMNLTDETRDMIIKKIFFYSDWHYPGLEIGPGDGEWTEYLVGNDPLYLVDQYEEFIETTKSKFTPEFQRRLRGYTVKHHTQGDDTDISFLPENQFGFVFSWNVFNYFPLEHVKKYLTQCYRVMRPGGVMMFSYNNGENPVCAEFVEQGYMSYMPKDLLISLIEHLGFELIAAFDRDDFVHWVEIRKPGVKQTVKAHQAMGEIIYRNC